ncbi:alpha/beta hydrolase [Nitriliruptoria bacterium AS10]|nr:alpha/beta hydrolase [Salsipaludibacter albus]
MLGFDETDFSPDNLARMRATLTGFMAAAQAELTDNDGVASEDRVAPGPDDNDVPVRVYRPVDHDPSTPLPGIYWIHGGGMVLGDLDGSDPGCEAWVDHLGCVVVSVDYRLAPEHPHPAPVEDCFAGLVWMAEHAGELGVDASRIAVAGASAGGGLAAGTCLLARDREGPDVAFQCLVYPMLDDRNETPSAREFAGIVSWSHEHNTSGWAALLGDAAGGDDVSPYAAPARASDLSGLPPTLVQVGDLEVFRDEDVDYALRLMQAGVPTELHVYPGAFHAADGFAPEADHSARFLRDQFDALARALGG